MTSQVNYTTNLCDLFFACHDFLITHTELLRGICILVSLVQVSWFISSHTRSMRRLTPGKKNLSCVSGVLIFLWRFFMVSSRAAAVVLFTTQFGCWIIPIAIAHWGVMTVWVMHQGTNFCSQISTSSSVSSSNASNSRLQRRCHVDEDDEEGDDYDNQGDKPCQEYFLNMIIGILYLFCYIPVKDEPSRWKYTFFYVITFCENTIFTLSWFYSLRHLKMRHHLQHESMSSLSHPSLPWFTLPALVFVFGSFFLGIFFQLLYYRYFHPNGKPLLVNRAAKCC